MKTLRKIDAAASRSIKIDSSSQSTENTTNVLELNDDCLQEVFELLDPDSLSVVADVCTRFRTNAVNSARSNVKQLIWKHPISVHDYSKLRNFGASIKTVEVCCCGSCSLAPSQCEFFEIKNTTEFLQKHIELLNRYCNEEAIELKIIYADITDEIAILMMPLLARVRKLEFKYCFLRNSIFFNFVAGVT